MTKSETPEMVATARRVTKSRKGQARDILGLYGNSFGYVDKTTAINQIESGKIRDYVQDRFGHKSNVGVYHLGGYKELHCSWHTLCEENLASIPDC